jgi:hypothetical protein
MADRTVATSPQVYARVGGWLYLFIIVAGILAELLVKDKVIVSGDATATATNIEASELSFRISVAVEQVWLACAVAVAMVLYVLLKPVNKNLALLATFFNLVSIAVQALASMSLYAALFPLGDVAYLRSFQPGQLHTLAYLCLKFYDYGYASCLVFFGCSLFFYGFLIVRSGFFPKTIGVLLIIASFSYLVNSFTLFIVPAFANAIFPILVLAFIGEASLCVWLIVKGVDVEKWDARVRALREVR